MRTVNISKYKMQKLEVIYITEQHKAFFSLNYVAKISNRCEQILHFVVHFIHDIHKMKNHSFQTGKTTRRPRDMM